MKNKYDTVEQLAATCRLHGYGFKLEGDTVSINDPHGVGVFQGSLAQGRHFVRSLDEKMRYERNNQGISQK